MSKENYNQYGFKEQPKDPNLQKENQFNQEEKQILKVLKKFQEKKTNNPQKYPFNPHNLYK
jgi:hypothetical protein